MPRSATDPASASAPSSETDFAARYDVIIVGAGVAGCALAQALAQADVEGRRSILVLDLHREVSPRFSGEFIHPRGAAVLDALGFMPALLEAGAVEVDGFVVREHADTDEPVRLDYASVPNERARGVSVHHKRLVRCMRQLAAENPQVSLRTPWRVTDVLTQPAKARDARIWGVVAKGPGGRVVELRADLVVAADGKASSVRKFAGIPDARRNLGFTAGLEVADAAQSNPLHANVYLGGPGPMLCYPIIREADGTLVSRLTFDLPKDLPAKGRELAPYLLETFVPHLPERLAGQVAAALEAQAALGPVEMAPTFDLPAPPATAPGLALVGDAAGCSHPITASGMTMGLLDAHYLALEASRRASVAADEAWLDDRALRNFRVEHERYVPTRQALADAIFEAFRGEDNGARGIRRALFHYWRSGERQRVRSLALLSCAERRPHVFLSEYLKTARHVVGSNMTPRHAEHFPVRDRLRQVHGAVGLAGTKVGLVASVAWSQLRPTWLTA